MRNLCCPLLLTSTQKTISQDPPNLSFEDARPFPLGAVLTPVISIIIIRNFASDSSLFVCGISGGAELSFVFFLIEMSLDRLYYNKFYSPFRGYRTRSLSSYQRSSVVAEPRESIIPSLTLLSSQSGSQKD